MKQNISPATAAIIAVVAIAVVVLVCYKFFIQGSAKGKSSASEQDMMRKAMATYGGQQRSNAERAGSQAGSAGAMNPGR